MIYLSFAAPIGPADAARLTLNDEASPWPRASPNETIDVTDRIGRSFTPLSSRLDNHDFMRCPEETAGIGDPRERRLEEWVRTCVSLSREEADRRPGSSAPGDRRASATSARSTPRPAPDAVPGRYAWCRTCAGASTLAAPHRHLTLRDSGNRRRTLGQTDPHLRI